MTTHTDRIRQMAQEAKAYADSLDTSGQLAGREWIQWRDERFAQLVAEDCARIGDSYGMPDGTSQAAIYIAQAIRDRYSLKD